MKIAGIGLRSRPNCPLLWKLQKYITKGWVYREGQGWVFAELTLDELAEFRSYQCGITIPWMRVRLPYGYAIMCDAFNLEMSDRYINWFVYCTMPQLHPLIVNKFHIHQITEDELIRHRRHPVEPGSYETWLWADDVKFCQELGCEITVHHGYGWHEWGVPPEWKPPLTTPTRLQSKEHTFIYSLVDAFTQEVRYVGKSDNPEQRLLDHLKDTNNSAKLAWIQSLDVQGHKPKLVILEEVAVAVEFERERYWISYYWKQGHNLTNDVCRYWHK